MERYFIDDPDTGECIEISIEQYVNLQQKFSKLAYDVSGFSPASRILLAGIKKLRSQMYEGSAANYRKREEGLLPGQSREVIGDSESKQGS